MRTPQFIEYDVLAVPGSVWTTIHVELAGSVPDGTRIDGVTGDKVVVIGQVYALNVKDAFRKAVNEYLAD